MKPGEEEKTKIISYGKSIAFMITGESCSNWTLSSILGIRKNSKTKLRLKDY